MMACSAALSTSVTKSLTCFCATRTDSTSRAARLMMAPAARAALMATLSMGCRLVDIDCEALAEQRLCKERTVLSGKSRLFDAGKNGKSRVRRCEIGRAHV